MPHKNLWILKKKIMLIFTSIWFFFKNENNCHYIIITGPILLFYIDCIISKNIGNFNYNK